MQRPPCACGIDASSFDSWNDAAPLAVAVTDASASKHAADRPGIA